MNKSVQQFQQDANRLLLAQSLSDYANTLGDMGAVLVAISGADVVYEFEYGHVFKTLASLASHLDSTDDTPDAQIPDRTAGDMALARIAEMVLSVACVRGTPLADCLRELAYFKVTGRTPSRPTELVARFTGHAPSTK